MYITHNLDTNLDDPAEGEGKGDSDEEKRDEGEHGGGETRGLLAVWNVDVSDWDHF